MILSEAVSDVSANQRSRKAWRPPWDWAYGMVPWENFVAVRASCRLLGYSTYLIISIINDRDVFLNENCRVPNSALFPRYCCGYVSD